MPVVGLCAACKHASVVRSAKGSTFMMCELAKTDTNFNKYPPLPVIQCVGYQENKQSDEQTEG